LITPEFKEMTRASSLHLIFRRDYIPLRKESAPHDGMPKDMKYPLVTPDIPPGVVIEGDLMGKVAALNFSNHDIIDALKFPELAQDKCLHTKSVPGTSEILVEP
jgi:hypothetical protein